MKTLSQLNQKKKTDKQQTGNSRFKKWRKMCKIHIFLSQEFLY
jgi:hypothetical protein